MNVDTLHVFKEFPKIFRLSREMVVTEKIDGENASIIVSDDGADLIPASRTMTLSGKGLHGFAAWVMGNKQELLRLGPGQHYGEWWGKGIRRGYNQTGKRFSLFNTTRWEDPSTRPACCDCVPVLFIGPFNTSTVEDMIDRLRIDGSVASPGFMNPEGVVVFHVPSGYLFKKTIKDDGSPKSLVGVKEPGMSKSIVLTDA